MNLYDTILIFVGCIGLWLLIDDLKIKNKKEKK